MHLIKIGHDFLVLVEGGRWTSSGEGDLLLSSGPKT